MPRGVANPSLQLYAGGTLLASNDDWQTNANAAQLTASTLAPTNPLESALLVRLEPGPYTTVVTNSDGSMAIARSAMQRIRPTSMQKNYFMPRRACRRKR